MILAGLIAARFTHYTALMILFGAAVFTLFARPEARAARQPSGAEFQVRLHRTLVWSSLASLVTALAVLAFTSAYMAGNLAGMIDAATLATILRDTDFGRVWTVRLVLAGGLTAWFAARLRRNGAPWSDRGAALTAGALAAAMALTGHAQIEGGAAGWLHRLSDAVHLLAAGVWLGALPPFLFLLRRSAMATGPAAVTTGRLLERFHFVGLLAVTTLLASGLINSWFLVGGLDPLIGSPYGRLLLVKLALFIGMVALGADNRLRLVPQLNRALRGGLPAELWAARLRRRIGAEFTLGLAVVLAVAVLGAIAPASPAD